MDNPIKAIRLSLGLSQGDLIRYSGLNRMVVLRTEQGLYSSPSAQITSPLIELSGAEITHEELVGLYKSSQRFTRQSQNWWVGGIPPVAELNHLTGEKVHPFVALRESKFTPSMFRSRMGFCKAFCLHPNSMRLFEHGEQITLPESLSVGLTDAGMSPGEVVRWQDTVLLWAQRAESAG